MIFKKIKHKVLTEEEIEAKFKDVEFEDNDSLALFLAAIKVFLPGILIMLAIFVGVIWLIFL